MAKRGYWKNILVGIDQSIGTIFGIDADETISSFVGRNYPGKWQEKTINHIFYTLTGEENHCKENIEPRFLGAGQ